MQLEEEGCLSVPGFNGHGGPAGARRRRGPWTATARPRTIEGTGLLARALAARNRPSRRHAVPRPAARHQARPHRPARSASSARRQLVMAAAHPLLRHAGVRRADARRAARPRRTTVVARRHAARSAARTRAEGDAPAPVKALAPITRGSPCSSPTPARTPAFLDALGALPRRTSASSPPTGGSCPSGCSTCRASASSTSTRRCCRAGAARRRFIARFWPATPRPGVTIMRVVLALDAGPMLARDRVPIGPNETSAELEPRLADAGARAARRHARSPRRAGRCAEEPQDEAAVTYAPRLERARKPTRLGAAGPGHSQPHSRPPAVAARGRRLAAGRRRAVAPFARRRAATSRRDARARSSASTADGLVVATGPARSSGSSSCSPRGGRPMPVRDVSERPPGRRRGPLRCHCRRPR